MGIKTNRRPTGQRKLAARAAQAKLIALAARNQKRKAKADLNAARKSFKRARKAAKQAQRKAREAVRKKPD
jgi:hypothetical protein